MFTLFYFKDSVHQKTLWTDWLKSQPNSDYALKRFESSYDKFPELFESWPVNSWFFPVDFIDSNVAVKNGIDNLPTDPNIWTNIVTLVKYYLIPLRERVKLPIVISSGYRCPLLNKAVDGASNSFHLSGRAVDISCTNNLKLFNSISRLAISNRKAKLPALSELIQYKTFIHLAV